MPDTRSSNTSFFKFHNDGLTIGNTVSLRLSNVQKNLGKIAQGTAWLASALGLFGAKSAAEKFTNQTYVASDQTQYQVALIENFNTADGNMVYFVLSPDLQQILNRLNAGACPGLSASNAEHSNWNTIEQWFFDNVTGSVVAVLSHLQAEVPNQGVLNCTKPIISQGVNDYIAAEKANEKTTHAVAISFLTVAGIALIGIGIATDIKCYSQHRQKRGYETLPEDSQPQASTQRNSL